MNATISLTATAQAKARYNRIAPVYDLFQSMSERRFKPLRQKLWAQARGKVLEVGIGTGLNLGLYPQDIQVVGIDIADAMLARARERAAELGLQVELREGDAQALNFPDNSFDTAASTFVFCSVPDPPCRA